MQVAEERPWEESWALLDEGAADSRGSRQGGQGLVLRVTHRRSEALGALKVMHPEHLKNRERRMRMAREVIALERVERPGGVGIPRVLGHNMHAVGQVEVPLYFVMQWIDAPTLTRYAGGRPVPLDEAVRITRRLVDILVDCHSREVYHRDIKPDNVLLDRDTLQPYLVDFGTAWTSAESPGGDELVTELGQELGNRFLRLPDLAAGRERRDPRTDVTAAVGILFFLLTGRAPRVLVDESARPPHDALASSFPRRILEDPRWPLVRRLFHVGFQLTVDLRFQSAYQLLGSLEEIIGYRAPESGPAPYSEAVAVLQELLASDPVRSALNVERTMATTAKALEERWRELAAAAGLIGSTVSQWPDSVEGSGLTTTMSIKRREASLPVSQTKHLLALSGPARSEITAWSKLGDAKPHEYYRGPAADTEGLVAAMLRHAEVLFRDAVLDLAEKLRRRLGLGTHPPGPGRDGAA